MRQKIRTITSMVSLVVTALLLVIIIFGWYATNKVASVSGGSGSTAGGSGEIIIRKTADGEDITYSGDATPTNKLSITINEGNTKISPDSNGTFTFFVEYDESSHNDTYNANITFEIKASQVLDERNKATALQYINSHVLLFKSYDSTSKKYSNWISPTGASYAVTESDEAYVHEVTVYWVWVGNYEDLYNLSNTSLISSGDKTSIRSYYSDKLSHMFENSDNSEIGFNGADYVIGTALKKVYFELTATKGEASL